MISDGWSDQPKTVESSKSSRTYFLLAALSLALVLFASFASAGPAPIRIGIVLAAGVIFWITVNSGLAHLVPALGHWPGEPDVRPQLIPSPLVPAQMRAEFRRRMTRPGRVLTFADIERHTDFAHELALGWLLHLGFDPTRDEGHTFRMRFGAEELTPGGRPVAMFEIVDTHFQNRTKIQDVHPAVVAEFARVSGVETADYVEHLYTRMGMNEAQKGSTIPFQLLAMSAHERTARLARIRRLIADWENDA